MIKQRNDQLTKEQELELGKKIQLMKFYTDEENYDFDSLTQEEQKVVLEGQEALEILVGNYINLARDVAHKHHKRTGTRYALEDLIQDAVSALIESAYAYDPSRDCKLGTYAYYGIAKKVSSTINYQRLVRLPENKMGEYVKITNAQREFSNLSKEEKEKYPNELAYVYKHVALKKEEINLILENMQPQVSLNATMYENEGELMDILKDENSENEIKKVESIDENLERLLMELNQYQRDLIAFEFEVIQPSKTFAEFMEENQFDDKKLRSETRKTITRLSNIAKKKNIKVTI